MTAMDGKEQIGQGLSRLLNLSEGILGQGTNILILATTNEDGQSSDSTDSPCASRARVKRTANSWYPDPAPVPAC
jgi:hypothetical protein